MASGHASRQWLEAFKFTVYVVTPIAATVYLGTGAYPYLEKIIHNTAYIVYPPEQTPPPKSAAALAEKVEDMRRKNAALVKTRREQLPNENPKKN